MKHTQEVKAPVKAPVVEPAVVPERVAANDKPDRYDVDSIEVRKGYADPNYQYYQPSSYPYDSSYYGGPSAYDPSGYRTPSYPPSGYGRPYEQQPWGMMNPYDMMSATANMMNPYNGYGARYGGYQGPPPSRSQHYDYAPKEKTVYSSQE